MAKEAVATLHARLIGDTASYQKSMRAASVETGRFYAKAQTGSKAASKFGVGVQAAGYQVNDFVVQVMAGQSALTAFAQQGSQFAGVFGPKGAIVGAGIAIASVVAQLMFTSKAAKQATIDVRSLADELKTFKELREDTRFKGLDLFGKKADLEKQLAESKERVRELLEFSNEYQMRKTRERLAAERAGPGMLSTDARAIEIMQQLALLEENRGKAEENLATVRMLQTEQLRLLNELKDVNAQINDEEQERINKIQEANKKRLEEIQAYFSAWRKEMSEPLPEFKDNTWEQQVAANAKSAEKYLDLVKTDSEKLQMELEKVQELVFSENLTQEQADQISQALQTQKEKTKEFSDYMSDMWNMVSDRAGQAFADMLLTGENAFNKLADIVARSVLEITARMAIINPILNMVFGGSTGWTRLPTMFGAEAPTKATGGPVIPNQPYRWNELGKEYFVPDTAGKVVKQNSMTGPSFVINQSFSGGVTPQDLGRAVPQIVKMTKQAIFDANQRWQPS